MMRLLLLTSFLFALPAQAADHGTWNTLLGKYATGGKVDYAGIGKDAGFKAYVEYIGKTDPASAGGGKAELAYWINAYNALVINHVLAQGPGLKSVMAVKDFFKQQVHTVGGKKMSLDAIEHEVIRKRWNEPRIHAALNCAAKSCPPIAAWAFTGAKLDAQLETQFQGWISNAALNTIPASGQVKLSKLFEWFKVDFDKNGGIAKYVGKYVKDDAARKNLEAAVAAGKVVFLEYDWALNKK